MIKLPHIAQISMMFFVATVVIAASVCSNASASSNQVMTMEAGDLFYDGLREKTLDEIKSLGVNTVKVSVQWHKIAPQPNAARKPHFDAKNPAAYPNWGVVDKIFADTKARGMKINLSITGPVPRWATKSKKDFVTEPIPGEFEAFAIAAGKRYGKEAVLWSIWNEPNHPKFLKPQFGPKGNPVAPRLYRNLYLVGHRGLRAAGVSPKKILFGELMPSDDKKFISPMKFVREALCVDDRYRKKAKCAQVPMEGIAVHPYTANRLPAFHRFKSNDRVSIGMLSNLSSGIDRLTRLGVIPRNVGIYVTEFGYQSKPDPGGAELHQQAEFIAQAERIAFLNPRVRLYSQYLLRDDKPHKGPLSQRFTGTFESGLRHSDGRIKPSYNGFMLPLVATDYRKNTVLWGLVRPARNRTRIKVEFRDANSRQWKKLKDITTNTRGVWGVGTARRKARKYRVVWTSPSRKVITGPAIGSYERK